MNINDINTTINQLENGNTTFEACNKLASLYIVREHLMTSDKAENKSNNVVKEYNDILPSYNTYIDAKKRYSMQLTDDRFILSNLNRLCKEIEEFIQSLYTSTESEEEREIIRSFINNLIF